MRTESVLLAAALMFVAATVSFAGEQSAGAGAAAGEAGVEKPSGGDRPTGKKADTPPEKFVVNYEELFGCKPMDGADGHEHVKGKR